MVAYQESSVEQLYWAYGDFVLLRSPMVGCSPPTAPVFAAGCSAGSVVVGSAEE
jgi:hypothetical protein